MEPDALPLATSRARRGKAKERCLSERVEEDFAGNSGEGKPPTGPGSSVLPLNGGEFVPLSLSDDSSKATLEMILLRGVESPLAEVIEAEKTAAELEPPRELESPRA